MSFTGYSYADSETSESGMSGRGPSAWPSNLMIRGPGCLLSLGEDGLPLNILALSSVPLTGLSEYIGYLQGIVINSPPLSKYLSYLAGNFIPESLFWLIANVFKTESVA